MQFGKWQVSTCRRCAEDRKHWSAMLGKALWSNGVTSGCQRLKSRVGIDRGDEEGVSGVGHRVSKGQMAGRNMVYF